jgi:drug/metabolite transporter (DMT)-like permease
VLFVGGLVRVNATRASILMLLEPVSAMLVGALVWHELPSALGVLGAILVLLAAWSVARARLDGAAPGEQSVLVPE